MAKVCVRIFVGMAHTNVIRNEVPLAGMLVISVLVLGHRKTFNFYHLRGSRGLVWLSSINKVSQKSRMLATGIIEF